MYSKWLVNPVVSEKVTPEDPEIKAIISVNAIQAAEEIDSVMHAINNLSSWICLKGLVVWLLRLNTLLLYLGQKRKPLKASLVQSGLDNEQLEERLQEEMQSAKALAAGKSLTLEEFDMADCNSLLLSEKEVSR